MKAETATVAAYLDEFLHIHEMPDSAGALNGLQVTNEGQISRVAAAVDASERAIEEAGRSGCDLLLVHHGLFWDGNQPVVGRRYRKLKRLLDGGIAVYAAHIPLDAHPEVGNNAVLARELGIALEGTFGDYRGVKIGVYGRLEMLREGLAAHMHDLLGAQVRYVPGGSEKLKRVGVITGAGSDAIGEAIALGLAALVTGEGPHHSYFEAMEGGINLYYGGHWATETWGVRALADHLEKKFAIPWEFLELPTGF
jgi:dinuclear metal center YbgI/SA1388 family protein